VRKKKILHNTVRAALVAAAPVLAFAPSARSQEGGTLRMGVGSQVTSLDPHFHNISPNTGFGQQVFDTLVQTDPNGRPRPGLAESWRPVGEDIWEFRLRPGVKFQNGSDFTADDVAFTLERVPNVPNSPGLFTAYTQGIRSVEVVDPLTVRMHTDGPAPLVPVKLAQVMMLDRQTHEGASTEDFNSGRLAIGTGPFKVVEHRPGSLVVLARNDAYWGEKPAWSRVEYRMMTNDAARTAALLAGDIDVIDTVPTTDVERLRHNERVKLAAIDSLRLVYLSFDHLRTDGTPFVTGPSGEKLDRNPLRDQRVRQALSLAVDRQAIASRVMEGIATPTGQFMPPGTSGYTPDIPVPAVQLEEAKRLLAEAGYPKGFRITLHGPNDRYQNDARIVQAVAQMWTRIGVPTAVDVAPYASFIGKASRQEFSAFLVSWGSSTGEAGTGLLATMGTFDRSRGMGAVNRARYSNPAFDEKVLAALHELDEERREDLMREATRIAMKDVAILPIHFQRNIWAMRPGLRFEARMDERTRAQDVRPAETAAKR